MDITGCKTSLVNNMTLYHNFVEWFMRNKSLQSAYRWEKILCMEVRPIFIDGVEQYVYDDWRYNRLNVKIENNKITNIIGWY